MSRSASARVASIAAMLEPPRWSVRAMLAASAPSGSPPAYETLARIAAMAGLPPPAKRITSDLHRQLGFLEALNRIDTTGVEPLARLVPEVELADLEALETSHAPDQQLHWVPTALAAEHTGPFFVVKHTIDRREAAACAP